MSSIPKRWLTPQEYLAQERKASFKSEYYQGEMFAMAGASREHNLVVAAVVGECRNLLKGRDCEVYPSDMRVKITATGLYSYPDVTIVCGQPRFEDDQFDTLVNPTVLFEVLSETTKGYDQGTKSSHYRQIRSLKEYVLIATDLPRVERYTRQADGDWLLHDVTDRSDHLELQSIGIRLPLAEIYEQISFNTPKNEATTI